MTNLFKRAAVITDLHFGLKSNSLKHNEDCLRFLNWVVTEARAQGCETCLFLGDYHNNRSSMNLVTMQYALRGMETLSENFDRVLFIPGNHDLFFRDKRDTFSVEWARHIPNVTIVNDWFSEGDVVIAPWLVGDDHKKIKKMKGRYMFGHFELPGYLMNAMVAMPDHGEISREDFAGFEHVFSGHFHKRQTQKNVTYVGNCFPHNYADAGDDDRGMMILDWAQQPRFISWPDQPRYRVFQLSDVLFHADDMLKPNMHVRVNIDVDLSYEEASFIKETFCDKHGLRELTLIPSKSDEFNDLEIKGNVSFESVDQIVTGQISGLDTKDFDPALLLNIYRNL